MYPGTEANQPGGRTPQSPSTDRQATTQGDKASNSTVEGPQEHKMATNPNPRANENIRDTPFETDRGSTSGVGSEITDGEAG